jgi:hypothetical protein
MSCSVRLPTTSHRHVSFLCDQVQHRQECLIGCNQRKQTEQRPSSGFKTCDALQCYRQQKYKARSRHAIERMPLCIHACCLQICASQTYPLQTSRVCVLSFNGPCTTQPPLQPL